MEKKETTKNHYLMSIKRTVNLIKLHRKARNEGNSEKIAYIEYKLKQLGNYSIYKHLDSKLYKELIKKYSSQIKIINYIEREGFISPEFQNVELTYDEILKACIVLENKGILKKRNCSGTSYEFDQ